MFMTNEARHSPNVGGYREGECVVANKVVCAYVSYGVVCAVCAVCARSSYSYRYESEGM